MPAHPLQYVRKCIQYLRAVPKSLYFNLKYFPLREAIKFPVLVAHTVRLDCCGGRLCLDAPLRRAMVRIGFGEVSIFDRERSRSIWHVNGTVVCKGQASLGHGSKVSVGEHGTLVLGERFTVTAEAQFICHTRIIFGDDVLVSWETLFMDTDFHAITQDGAIVNENREIVIGNHVWFGCRSTVLKGTVVGDHNVIAANSNLCGKTYLHNHTIIGGNPARVIKEAIDWSTAAPTPPAQATRPV